MAKTSVIREICGLKNKPNLQKTQDNRHKTQGKEVEKTIYPQGKPISITDPVNPGSSAHRPGCDGDKS